MAGYISEINVYGAQAGGDFVELAFPAGTDVSGYQVYAYKSDGTIYSGPFGLGSVQSTQNGEDVYVVDSGDGFSASFDSGIALVDGSGNVVQFISDDRYDVTATEGPAAGQTADGVGRFSSSETTQSSDGGHTYYNAPATKGSVACFLAGTLVDTPTGPRAIGELVAGDLVVTLDQGVQPLIWTGMSYGGVREKVVIQPDSLGPGLPRTGLSVSAQHRVLVGQHGQLETLFDTPQIVAAKALCALPGISLSTADATDKWHHITCARHAIVMSNGLAAESLLVGPMVRSGRYGRSLNACFPDADAIEGYLNGPPAHAILRVGVARKHINRGMRQAA